MRRYGGLWFPADEPLSVELRKKLDEPAGYHGDRLLEALEQVTDFSLAVDAGAYVGLWTRVLAERFARVIAFEPEAESYRCLEANTAAFANCELHRLALGEQAGRGLLAQSKGRIGSHLMYAEQTGNARIEPLDALALQKVSYMKVHANGYELPVLKGAAATIRRCRPVLTVVFKPKPESTARYGYTTEELMQYILGLGYRPGRGQKPYRVFVPGWPL